MDRVDKRATKTAEQAIEFYNKRVKELESNLQDLEKIVGGKSANLRVVEDGEFVTPLLWRCF